MKKDPISLLPQSFHAYARGENRTHMTLRSGNFKSPAATNYATRASCIGGGLGGNRTPAWKFCRLQRYHFATRPWCVHIQYRTNDVFSRRLRIDGTTHQASGGSSRLGQWR